MTALPTGTVTFLFTDIEGSTPLWEQHPGAMQTALEQYHAILREAIASLHGVVFNVAGDGLCAAFDSALDAVRAALSAQRDLQRATWGETPIRVRMGLHTGSAEAVNGDYRSGPTLNRAARIMSVAHGGQVLLSQTTADLLRGQPPNGISLRDLGWHRLKGLAETEHLWQVVSSDLPSEFPALRYAQGIPNNLPVQLTSFIGRERELAELYRLLNTTHLLTLTGSGGTGKTRLSLQLAAEVLSDFPDGVWLIELAPLTDPELIPQTILSALGLHEQPGRPLFTTLAEHLHDKRLLLILDNCEHLIGASARLANMLLHTAPELKILASSREGLGIAGETAYHVPSLPVPNAKGDLAPVKLQTFDAVRLFLDRAAAAKFGFALTNVNAPAIAQICSRLDGIPLALELAAARVKSLPVETIAARLDDRFRLLTGGSRTALPRQQTLRSTIDWSFNLLAEAERTLLRHLSVFAGGWTIEAAEAICGDNVEAGSSTLTWPGALPGVRSPGVAPTPEGNRQPRRLPLPSADVLDLLTHLVDKSLVVLDEQATEPRYRMLETVRQYAREKLADSGEAAPARDRHREFYLALAEEAEPQLFGSEQIAWFNRLEREHDNLRAAIAWSAERDDPVSHLRLAAALSYFWTSRGYIAEGFEHLTAALAADQTANNIPRARWARARALLGLVFMEVETGTVSHQDRPPEEALAIATELHDERIIYDAYLNLGRQSIQRGDYASARSFLEQAMARDRESGDRVRGWPFMFMGDVALFAGDFQDAESYYLQSATFLREVENKNILAVPLRRLGSLAARRGDFLGAQRLFTESLSFNIELGHRRGMAACVAAFATLYAARGQSVTAVQLYAAVDVLLKAEHTKMMVVDQSEFERNVAEVQARLDPASFNLAWSEGSTLSLEQAVAMVQQMPIAEQPTPLQLQPGEMPDDQHELTARERDVLRLLVQGLTDAQIAETLTVSTRTVNSHLRSIYSKLDVGTRTAAVRAARERGLV